VPVFRADITAIWRGSKESNHKMSVVQHALLVISKYLPMTEEANENMLMTKDIICRYTQCIYELSSNMATIIYYAAASYVTMFAAVTEEETNQGLRGCNHLAALHC